MCENMFNFKGNRARKRSCQEMTEGDQDQPVGSQEVARVKSMSHFLQKRQNMVDLTSSLRETECGEVCPGQNFSFPLNLSLVKAQSQFYFPQNIAEIGKMKFKIGKISSGHNIM